MGIAEISAAMQKPRIEKGRKLAGTMAFYYNLEDPETKERDAKIVNWVDSLVEQSGLSLSDVIKNLVEESAAQFFQE
jgi:hypothetical protein